MLLMVFKFAVAVCFSTDVTDTGSVPSSSSAVSSAAATSVTAVSEATSRLPSAAAAAAAVDSSVSSVAVTYTPHPPLYASSVTSTTSNPALCAPPLSVESLMATLSSMESMSIAMIAAQLVPVLANMDAQLFMQMVANPAVATAMSMFAGTQSAAVSDLRQMLVVSSQTHAQFTLPSAADGSGVLQNPTSVYVSSASQPVTVLPSASAVQCDRAVSRNSIQSSSSEVSGHALDSAVVLTDTAPSDSQFNESRESPDLHPPSLLDPHRPSSTASTSSSMYSSDRQFSKRGSVLPLGKVVYTCHLCPFQSSHRLRFSEHLASEFCTGSILEMAGRAPSVEPIRRKRCSHCSFSTYLSEEFDDHVRIHASSNVYCCKYCDYVGPSAGALRLHFRRSHPKKSFVLHNSTFGQVPADRGSTDRSGTPQPQSVDLDPVVDVNDLFTLDHRGVKKLKNQYGIAAINLCDREYSS